MRAGAGRRSWLGLSGGLLHALALAAATACGCGGALPPNATEPVERPPPLIAHAGGGLGHHTYSNSLDAIRASVQAGHRLIELDFHWTRDGRIVLQHDWGANWVARSVAPTGTPADAAPAAVPTFDEFLRDRTARPLLPPTLDELGAFMREHAGFDVVTDAKHSNVAVLEVIARELGDLRARFIPQIMHVDEWAPVAALGYDRIMLTLYVTPMDDEQVLAFARERRPWAVTMPWRRAEGTLPRRLSEAGIAVYAHTINTWPTVEALAAGGVVGVYTDWLTPADDARRTPAGGWPRWVRTATGERPLDGVRLTYLPGADMPMDLDLVNRSRQPQPVQLNVRDRDAEPRGGRAFVLAPGEVLRLRAQDLITSGQKVTVLEARADSAVEIDVTLSSPASTPVTWELAAHTQDTVSFAGDATGLVGQLLILANPGATTLRPRFRFDVDGEVALEQTAVMPAGSVRVFSVGFRDAEHARAEVSGAPVVVQHLVWNAHLTSMQAAARGSP